jgi:hypothetical protein
MGSIDVTLLALLRATRQQNDQRLAIAPEIDSVAGAKIDPILKHALTNGLDVGEIALSGHSHRHAGLRRLDGTRWLHPERRRARKRLKHRGAGWQS